MHGVNVVSPRNQFQTLCNHPDCERFATMEVEGDSHQHWCEVHFLIWDMKQSGCYKFEIESAEKYAEAIFYPDDRNRRIRLRAAEEMKRIARKLMLYEQENPLEAMQ